MPSHILLWVPGLTLVHGPQSGHSACPSISPGLVVIFTVLSINCRPSAPHGRTPAYSMHTSGTVLTIIRVFSQDALQQRLAQQEASVLQLKQELLRANMDKEELHNQNVSHLCCSLRQCRRYWGGWLGIAGSETTGQRVQQSQCGAGGHCVGP